MPRPTNRDDFPHAVRRRVAERAAYVCSRPDCNRLTIGPHSDPKKVRSTGVAAHIRAASPEGPRYDPLQAATERAGDDNAMWLCAQCATLIDKDWHDVPPSALYQWKRQHESFIKTMGELGLRRGLAMAHVPPTERDTARRLISFLEDRRVLYALYDFEVPRHVLLSVQKIREELTRLRLDVAKDSELDNRLTKMLVACRVFLDEAGDLDDDRRFFGGSRSRFDSFVAALGAMRKVFGLHLQAVATAYGTEVSADLARIIPSNRQDADGS